MFFMFFFFAIVQLGLIAFLVRWALSAPHGPFDGTARVLVGTVTGGLLAVWIVAAAIFPEMNDSARRTLTSPVPPTVAETRMVLDELVVSAPVDVTVATGIGAGLGFLVALASVGSFRRMEHT